MKIDGRQVASLLRAITGPSILPNVSRIESGDSSGIEGVIYADKNRSAREENGLRIGIIVTRLWFSQVHAVSD